MCVIRFRVLQFDSNMSASDIVIVIAVISNVLSVVGVVLTNKYIVETDGYNFMIFLSFLHFAFTGLGTRVLLKAEVFSYAAAEAHAVLPVAIVRRLTCMSLTFILFYPLLPYIFGRDAV